MNLSLETKALGWAVAVVALSLAVVWVASISITAMTASRGATTFSAGTMSQNMASPERIAQGQQYYEMSCSHCHGDDATGDDDGPDLHDLRISNAGIARSIKKGIKGQMPNFALKYDDQKIAAIVSYLRTLQ